jgi:hypothetical protein
VNSEAALESAEREVHFKVELAGEAGSIDHGPVSQATAAESSDQGRVLTSRQERNGMTVFLTVLRWTARMCGLVVAGAYLLIVLGDLSQPHATGPSTFIEWAGIVLMTAACAALVVAWRWEWQGAAVSLTALSLVAFIIRGSHTFHLSLLVMALPGLLHAGDWLAHHRYPA